MGDGAYLLMMQEIDLETGFAELEKKEFERQMGQRVAKKARELARREKEPSHHPFYTKEKQEETYFKHKNAMGEIIDVRNVGAEYAENLYNWYLRNHGYDESILFMRTLREIFQEVEDE